MGQHKETKACLFLALICMSTIMPALAAPNARKFAVKNNSPKKVYHKNIAPSKDNIERAERDQATQPMNKQGDAAGQQSELANSMNGPNGSPANLAWAIAAPLVQLLKVFLAGPNEMSGNELTPGSDKMDLGSGQGFSWGQVIGYGLKLLLAALGGGSGQPHDGIDKVGMAEHPMQGVIDRVLESMNGNDGGNANMVKQTRELINLAMSLIVAMQNSFKQRENLARSIGEKDRMADAALASLYMSKAFVKSFNTSVDSCREQLLCEAARECVQDVGSSSAFGFCHLTSFATANIMYYTHPSKGDMTKSFMEATRRGRSQENCKAYYNCNEVNTS